MIWVVALRNDKLRSLSWARFRRPVGRSSRPTHTVLPRCQHGIPSARAARDRAQWVCRAVHVSGQSNFRRVTSNRTDQAAMEDPGEWFSHSPILVDLRIRPPVILLAESTARGAEVRIL